MKRLLVFAFGMVISPVMIAQPNPAVRGQRVFPSRSELPEGRVAAGPERGSSSRFSVVSPAEVLARGIRTDRGPLARRGPEHKSVVLPDPPNPIEPLAPLRANEVEERSDSSSGDAFRLIPLLASPSIAFPGISATGSFPPDPVVAVGANHVLAAVNRDWAIFSKSGVKAYQTNAQDWFENVLPDDSSSLSIFDPQVAYDHFAGRWIILYVATDFESESWLLISVSAASDPNGDWYAWALRSDTNGGTPAANWSDYPALGFDGSAIYVTFNQYTYSVDSEFAYSKVRILRKDQLYGGAASPSWWDIWDLRDPGFPGIPSFTVRPAHTFGSAGAEYLVSNSPFETSSYVTLWTLSNPTTSPSISGVNVPVTASKPPPGADQFGGSPGRVGCPTPCLIDSGDGRITSAVYRNGSIWFSHGVGGGTGGQYSRARYARISTSTRAVLEDQSLGSDGCWSFYPSVAVDSVGNLIMVFGRSCQSGFAGVRFSGRAVADSSLQASTLIKVGEASYVVPVGDGTPLNRWGDYFGTAIDPADGRKIWLIGQYAADPGDTWKTQIAQVAVTCSAPPIPTAANNGPLVEGETLRLTASSAAGASYLWTGPNNFTSTEQNPLIPNVSVNGNGTYSVDATLGDCTSLLASTTVAVSPASCSRCIIVVPFRPSIP
jgi:hypothetical protein